MSNLELTDAQWASFAAEFCKGFTAEQAAVCRTFCEIRGLLPGKHVIFQLRASSEWDESVHAKVKTSKIVFITTIDAARLIAQRTGQYNGQDPEEYIYLDANGAPELISKIPLPQLPLNPGQQALPREPWAVKTTVYRKDFDHPISSVARFDAYAATYTKDGEVRLNEMWSRRGPEQLAKCSEMLSLRKSFPEELANLYLDTEFKPDQEEVVKQPISPAVAVPLPPPVPKVDHTPAKGTDAPRPGEKTWAKPDGGVVTEKQLTEQEAKVEAAKAAVPDLKPASELPEPKKRGRKPKSPDNGQPPAEGITEADIASANTPAPPEITEADKQAGADFVESTDPTPTKEEMSKFTARVRALAAQGALNADLKNYILNVGGVSDPKKLTVGNWEKALGELEALDKDKLKEVTKNAPLPAF